MDDLLIKNALVALNASRKAINQYMKYAAPEDLHVFRQEMKKLAAIRAYMKCTGKGRKIWRNWAELKGFYRMTSPLREQYIQQQWLQAEGIIFAQEQIQPTFSQELLQSFDGWKKYSKKTKQRLKKSTLSAKHKNLADFVQQCRQNAMILLSVDPPGKEWHEARKWIKFSVYLEKIAMRIQKCKPGPNKNCPWVYLGGLLGDWHDNLDLGKFMEQHPEVIVHEKSKNLEESRISLEQAIRDQLLQL
jgi:hypothetical protein